jgi:hypothetical protein
MIDRPSNCLLVTAVEAMRVCTEKLSICRRYSQEEQVNVGTSGLRRLQTLDALSHRTQNVAKATQIAFKQGGLIACLEPAVDILMGAISV